MNLPVDLLHWLAAFAPIAMLLFLMIKRKWGIRAAAPVGLAVTVLTGLCFYRADPELILLQCGKGAWSALPILLIIATAILLYQVGEEAGAFPVIRNGMRKFLPNELLLVLAMGWVLESFLQGITGFGVPVAVGAPLLMGIGVRPVWAVIIPLLGQSWGNTYGTLAVSWDMLAASAGMEAGSEEYLRMAFWACVFLWLWNLVIGLAICWFYGKGRALKKGLPAVILLSLVQGGGELLMTRVSTTLACFLPACVSLILVVVLGRTRSYREKWQLEDSGIMDREKETKEEADSMTAGISLPQAFVPYFLLTFIALGVLLVEPVRSFLGRFEIGLPFPETATGYGFVNEATADYGAVAPFTHASMFLLVAGAAAFFYYRKRGWIKAGGAGRIIRRTCAMIGSPCLAVVVLVMMSMVMSGTGQTLVLAKGIAGVLGRGYIVLAPFVGALGSFMTGSNMNSNILFGEFQTATAKLLEVDSSMILGAQTAGASIGAAVSPSNIVLGAATAGILGREGEVLRRILKLTVPAAVAVGAILFLAVGI
ncbi:MAG: L-lactate permease [Lachnospiraceae bacterium]